MRSLNEIISNLSVGERHVADGISEAVYHKSIGIGSSAMRAATKSMAHYKAYIDRKVVFTSQQEKNMRIGSATHCLTLEPELYDEKFIVQPKDIKIRKGDKWEKFKTENAGKEILMRDEAELAGHMTDSIFDSPASRYFTGGKAEQSVWYRHESGLILKSRLDYHVGDLGVDLKTTVRDTKDAFARWIKYDYDIQDSLYRLVTDVKDFIFIGSLKSAPHCAFISKQGELVRRRANRRLHKAIADIATAKQFDDYPGIPVELIETTLTEREIQAEKEEYDE